MDMTIEQMQEDIDELKQKLAETLDKYAGSVEDRYRLQKDNDLKDSWVRHHQGSVEAEMKLRHKLEEKIKTLEKKLAAATPESSEATQVDKNTK